MNTLFDIEENVIYKPLADKLRPTTLEEFIGQEDVVGKDSPLYQMIEQDNISSMIFWGPPGVGKTTLAKIIANKTNSVFKELSAVTSGVKEVKAIFDSETLNIINENIETVYTNISFLKNLGVSNYQDAFLRFYNMFLIEPSSFEEIFQKYDKEDLIAKLEKNVAIMEHL